MVATTPPEYDSAFDVQRWATAFCLLISLVGVGINLHLTRIKFQMPYPPCLSVHGACQIGGLHCDDALGSPVSMLLDLPISLWGAAFYLTTAVAAAMVLRGRAHGGAAAHLLLVLAGFAVLVSVALGMYTWLALTTACPFCLTLYAVSVLLFGGALLVWRPPGGPHMSFDEFRRTHLADGLDGLFALMVVLVVATGAQSVAFHGLRNAVDAQDGCPDPITPLPAPSIRVGAEDPRAILPLFVDMTCIKCRGEFKKLGLALKEGRFPAPVQLWIFHIPRHACDPTAFPGGYDRAEDGPGFDNACMAARAAECMEKLQAGTGFALIGGIFTLHDSPPAEGTPLFTADRIGSKPGDVVGLEIYPDDADNALFHCINHDSEVLARITAHQIYADDPAFTTPTLLIFSVADGAPDLSRKPLVANAAVSLGTIMDYVATKAAESRTP